MIYYEFLTIEMIKSVFHKLEFTHDFKTLGSISIIVNWGSLSIKNGMFININQLSSDPHLPQHSVLIMLSLKVTKYFYYLMKKNLK